MSDTTDTDTPTLPFPEPGAAPWAHDGDQIPGWYYDGTGLARTIVETRPL